MSARIVSGVNHLLSPEQATSNANNPTPYRATTSSSPLHPTSPLKSHSPSKDPLTSDDQIVALSSSISPPSDHTLPFNNRERPHRPTGRTSLSAVTDNMDDADEEEADVTMGDLIVDDEDGIEEDGDEEGEGIEEGEEGAEGDDDGGDGDEETDDDEEDDDDDDDSSSDDSDDSERSVEILDGPDGVDAPKLRIDGGTRIKSEPADADAIVEGGDAAVDENAEPEVTQLQPKKKKRRVHRSPSSEVDLPPPPPPMETIRFELELPGPDQTLDWNFVDAAAQAGVIIPNAWGEDPLADDEPIPNDGVTIVDAPPEPLVHSFTELPPGVSAEEAREMEEMARKLEEKYEKPKKKHRQKRVIEYDLNDPFIDDSDLQIDAPTHVARPKKEGFFVHQGPLELMEESPTKPRQRNKTGRTSARFRESKEPRKSLSEALRDRVEQRHAHIENGTRDSPISIDSDDQAGPSTILPLRRSPSPPDASKDNNVVDRTLFKTASREAKYLPPFNSFPDEVAHRLRALRRASAKHVWDVNNKGKFPEHLKIPLGQAGDAAIRFDLLCISDKDQNDASFERYQEKSFVTALCSVLPYNKLTLGKLVLKLCYNSYWKWLQECENEGVQQYKELLDPEIPQMLETYKKAQDNLKERQQDPPEIHDLVDIDPETAKAKKAVEPGKKPVFTQDMRDIFRQLVDNTQEMVDINKKMEEWGQKIEGQSSEINMRKTLYNKIIKLYPDGFMSSNILSRAFTMYKRQAGGAGAAVKGVDA